MREYYEREALCVIFCGFRIIEMHRYLAEAAVLFEGISPRVVNKNGGGLPDRIFTARGQSFITCKNHGRNETETDQKNTHYTGAYDARLLLFLLFPAALRKDQNHRNQRQNHEKAKDREKPPSLPERQ